MPRMSAKTPCSVARSSEMARQVGAQHVDHEGSRAGGREQQDMGALAHRDQRGGRLLAIGDDQHRRLERDDARDAAAAILPE